MKVCESCCRFYLYDKLKENILVNKIVWLLFYSWEWRYINININNENYVKIKLKF